MEDYREGHRIRNYTIEGWSGGEWQKLCSGQSIGRKKIDYFPEIEVSKIRLQIDKNVGTPLIRIFSAYYVENFLAPPKRPVNPWSDWKALENWKKSDFSNGEIKLKIDLTTFIKLPGQFTIKVVPDENNQVVEIIQAEIYYEGRKALDEFVTIKENEVKINRSAMVTDESSSVLHITLKSLEPCNGKVEFKPALIY